jgi:maltoporin
MVEPAPAPESAPAPAHQPTHDEAMNEDFVRRTVDGMKKAFEFHGYFRSGFGINGNGGKIETFQAPGAFSKYRLGNESDTYGEVSLTNNWMNPKDDGVSFKTSIMLAFSNQGYNNFDTSGNLVIREAYAEAGNVIPSAPGMTFWAGQRFYQRHDVHITDFFFLDNRARSR